jgi:hypothetical protein
VASLAAQGRGGGIYLYVSAIEMRGNRVGGNVASVSAEGWGDGLYLFHSSAPLAGNEIANGGEAADGSQPGGVYLYQSNTR